MQASRLAELAAARMPQGGRARGLATTLRALISDGRLLQGDRLPAERALADALQLSRSTVTAANDQLRGEGFLVGRQGSGTFVSLPAAGGAGRPDEEPGPGASVRLDLSIAAMPAPAILGAGLAAAAESVTRYGASTGLQPLGLSELRAIVAADYSQRGIPTHEDQILVTGGALHAWDLLLRSLARPGATVVTEEPTYPGVIDAAAAHRVRLRPLPVDGDGWHPEELDPTRPPVLAHLTFDGHNPTGAWADRATRGRVLEAFDPSTVVAVDETMIDYPGPEVGDQPSRPVGDSVVLVGSTSKSLWAGLRVGWIRASPATIRRLAVARAGQDIAPPVLDQLVVIELLRRRDEILPERRRTVDERRSALFDAIGRLCPTWSVIPPSGGLNMWIDLGGRSSTQLAGEARRRGIRITPGPRFTHNGTRDGFLRLPHVLPVEQLLESVQQLAEASADLRPAVPRRRSTAATAWSA